MTTQSHSRILYLALAFAGTAFAQGQSPTTGAQGGASAQSDTSVSAGKTGATASHASSGNADAGHGSASLASGSELNATLSRPVDAGKSKPGDEVTATNAQDVKSDGHLLIPRGSKLMGHVTEAQPHGQKGSSGKGGSGAEGAAASATGSAESRLGIVFDRAVLKNGREVPLNATVQALGAAQSAASMEVPDMGEGAMNAGGAAGGAARGSGRGALGGVGGGLAGSVGGVARTTGGAVNSTVGGSLGAATHSAGAVGGLDAVGHLTAGSKGVFGLKGLELTSAAAGSAEGSVITSATHNVRLESGTNLLLVTGARTAGTATDSGPVKK